MSSKCFGVDASSSRHSENCEKKFLTLAEGPTDDINDSFGESEGLKIKGLDNIPPYCFGSASKFFSINETKEIALNCTLYDFLIGYGLIDVKDILHIHEYLMKKHNVK